MKRTVVMVFVLLLVVPGSAFAADWPTWRYDALRSANSPEQLPEELHLQWVREYAKLEPAWPDQPRMRFDVAYEPIVVGKTLYVASPRSDSITALDTETGARKWCIYTDGPVRFAPTAWKDRLFVASDDGYLHCISQTDGKVLWRFRGGLDGRMVIGNKRLISMWPTRGAPVVADDRVYFGSGIWPFMGTFIYCLDAKTGDVVWHNDRAAMRWMLQPHDTLAFAGTAPQGYLAAAGDKLLVPNGRSVPACFDRATGKLRYFRLAEGLRNGGYGIAGSGRYFFNACFLHSLETGAPGWFCDIWRGPERYEANAVIAGDALYFAKSGTLRAHKLELKESADREGNVEARPTAEGLWSIRAGAAVHIKAGSRLYASAEGMVTAVDIPKPGGRPKISWKGNVDGTPHRLIAADGKLFVSTLEGRIYCFGAEKVEPTRHGLKETPPVRDRWTRAATELLTQSEVTDGYAVAFGLENGRLVEELTRQSKLHVVAIDIDAERVDRIRRRLDAAGLYGHRVAILHADPAEVKLPPYVASLVVSEDPARAGCDDVDAFARRIFHALRPYGGAAFLPIADGKHADFAQAVKNAGLANAVTARRGGFTTLVREGALPGSADWTHQYANAGNTVCSKDKLVKPPLGILWFGGSTNYDLLPRHAHGPTEHVVGGRLFIEGPESIRALDVYTGRVIWQRTLPGLGKAFDKPDRQPGADALGSNYVSVEDGVYVVHEGKCLRLDPATGKTTSTFTVPAECAEPGNAAFSFVAIWKEFLIAGVSPMRSDWNPEFTSRTFHLLLREEKLEGILRQVQAWKGGPYFKRDEIENDELFAAKNFNQLLNETSLESKIPDELWTKTTATEAGADTLRKVKAYVLKRAAVGKYDVTLRALNRELVALLYPELPAQRKSPVGGKGNWDHASSRRLVVMNRHTGEVLWSRRATHAFRHNTIVAGSGKVFCVDRLPTPWLNVMKRRGIQMKTEAEMLAFDLRTGKMLWSVAEGIYGTWLGYCEEHDALFQGGRTGWHMLPYEPTKPSSVYRGRDGKLVWQHDGSQGGAPILRHDWIITRRRGYNIHTGKTMKWTNPLTGVPLDWTFRRTYGCGTPVASEHMLTFRSGAAGYYDLDLKGGTGNFGGYKSGCTSNLVAANGVLSSPDYTRTCTCSYQNQTSLALVHMPDVEVWTFNRFSVGPRRIRRLGVNLGAPGDRRTPEGTLWLEYPTVGGPSPKVLFESVPKECESFYLHSGRMKGGGLKWVGASGMKGLRRLTVTLAHDPDPEEPEEIEIARKAKEPRLYTVRLFFAEPERLTPGMRVFDVTLEGKTVLRDFDVVKAAGGPLRTIVREFRDVKVGEKLHITLEPARSAKLRETLLCGIEIIQILSNAEESLKQ